MRIELRRGVMFLKMAVLSFFLCFSEISARSFAVNPSHHKCVHKKHVRQMKKRGHSHIICNIPNRAHYAPTRVICRPSRFEEKHLKTHKTRAKHRSYKRVRRSYRDEPDLNAQYRHSHHYALAPIFHKSGSQRHSEPASKQKISNREHKPAESKPDRSDMECELDPIEL